MESLVLMDIIGKYSFSRSKNSHLPRRIGQRERLFNQENTHKKLASSPGFNAGDGARSLSRVRFDLNNLGIVRFFRIRGRCYIDLFRFQQGVL